MSNRGLTRNSSEWLSKKTLNKLVDNRSKLRCECKSAKKKADTKAEASIREKITVLSRVIKKERDKLWARKNYIPTKKIVKKKKEKKKRKG